MYDSMEPMCAIQQRSIAKHSAVTLDCHSMPSTHSRGDRQLCHVCWLLFIVAAFWFALIVIARPADCVTSVDSADQLLLPCIHCMQRYTACSFISNFADYNLN